MAVNKINEPVSASIRITGVYNGKARVLFENRSITFNGGVIHDQLAAFGSQVYLLSIKPETPVSMSSNLNLIRDAGFEDLSNPGLPSACYARPGGDR